MSVFACRDHRCRLQDDLRRLRLNGPIRRIEHTHTYVLNPDAPRIAVFYTKLYNRLLRPLATAGQPRAPPALRRALAVIDLPRRGLHHAGTAQACGLKT